MTWTVPRTWATQQLATKSVLNDCTTSAPLPDAPVARCAYCWSVDSFVEHKCSNCAAPEV